MIACTTDKLPETGNSSTDNPTVDEPQGGGSQDEEDEPGTGGGTVTEPEFTGPYIEDLLEKNGWTEKSKSYSNLPSYIKIYNKSSASNAYVAVADTKKGAKWDVWSIDDPGRDGVSSSKFKTTSDVYYMNTSRNKVVMNAGYWYHQGSLSYSGSLSVSNKKVYSYNLSQISPNWSASKPTVYYVTRAAFLQDYNGKFDAGWSYWDEVQYHYLYQKPAANSFKTSPLDPKTYGNLKGATYLKALTAIGGGPLLINNGEVVNTFEAELFGYTSSGNSPSGVKPDIKRPRTAIGVTKDSKIVFFVCQGDGVGGCSGMNTATVAEILHGLGCVEAINLDGGGSTGMRVNGQNTITPSDNRPLASALILY